MRPSRRAFLHSATTGPILALASEAIGKPALTIASGGQSAYSIVLPPNPLPAEQWAARELQEHLRLITGATLPIASGTSGHHYTITLGSAAEILPPRGEGFAVQIRANNVAIRGGQARGTVYGVYAFLEKLGCRWYTADIAQVPHVRDLHLPESVESQVPAFDYRETFFTEAQGKNWSVRNRLNGHFHQLDGSTGGRYSFQPFAHSFSELVPPSRYFMEHPEYFAYIAGRRRPEGQLCLTNPDVLRIAIARVREWSANFPDASAISVSQNDGGGWCECRPCRQIIEGEGGAVSGLLLYFVNAVAAALPATSIDTLAYRETLQPPAKIKPRENVIVRFCAIDACLAHSYASCAFNDASHDAFRKWSNIAPHLYLWQYSANFSHYLVPFPNFRALELNLRASHQAGFAGAFIQGAGSGGGRSDDAELRAFVAARLLWNPFAKVEPEIRGFLAAVYGPADSLMRQYFDLQQNLVKNSDLRRGNHLWLDQDVPAPYLSAEFLRNGRRLLAQAYEIADTDATRKRIELRKLSLDYLDTIGVRRFRIGTNSYEAENARAALDKTRDFAVTAQRLGVTQLREGYPMERQIGDWAALTRSFPIVPIASSAFRVTVVPALEARIVSARSLSGGTEFLRVPQPGEWAYPRTSGIFPRLYTDRSGPAVEITWNDWQQMPTSVTLSGVSANGLSLKLMYRVSESGIEGSVSARNEGVNVIPTAFSWFAELKAPSMPATNRHSEPSAQPGQWAIALHHRAEPYLVAIQWSPETDLQPGATLTLAVAFGQTQAYLKPR